MLRGLLLAGVALAVALVWIVVLPAAPAVQPITFSHAKHASASCALCHPGVERTARAGLPGIAVCTRCHATAPAGIAGGRWEELVRTRAVDWVRRTSMPDHVMFSHQRHVRLAGLECVSCHGDVGSRTRPAGRALVRLDMAACVSCHQQEAASQDCAACHR
jgi:hypothetical protein